MLPSRVEHCTHVVSPMGLTLNPLSYDAICNGFWKLWPQEIELSRHSYNILSKVPTVPAGQWNFGKAWPAARGDPWETGTGTRRSQYLGVFPRVYLRVPGCNWDLWRALAAQEAAGPEPAPPDIEKWQGWNDQVALQQLRNSDLRETGESTIPDQGVGFNIDGYPVDKAKTPQFIWDRGSSTDPPRSRIIADQGSVNLDPLSGNYSQRGSRSGCHLSNPE